MELIATWASFCAALDSGHDAAQAVAAAAVARAGGSAPAIDALLAEAEVATADPVARMCAALDGTAGASNSLASLEASLQELTAAVGGVRAVLATARNAVLLATALPPVEQVAWLGLERTYELRMAALMLGSGRLPSTMHAYFAGRLAELAAAAVAVDGEDEGEEDGSGAGAMGDDSEAATGVVAVAATLRALGLEALTQEVCSSVACDHLRAELTTTGGDGGGYDKRILPRALDQCTSVPLRFLRLALPAGAAGEAALREWRARLGYFV